MRQIEVTLKVNDSLEEARKILESQSFKLIRVSINKDKYLTNIKSDNIIDLLNNSVLVRYVNINNSEKIFKKITHKKKVYDNDIVISEEKVSVNIDDINDAINLFKSLNYYELVDVNYNAFVYKKDDIEFCLQDVEGLGLLIEYENINDFKDSTKEEILEEKKKMVDIIKSFNLKVGEDFDIKKAYELIKKKTNNR